MKSLNITIFNNDNVGLSFVFSTVVTVEKNQIKGTVAPFWVDLKLSVLSKSDHGEEPLEVIEFSHYSSLFNSDESSSTGFAKKLAAFHVTGRGRVQICASSGW